MRGNQTRSRYSPRCGQTFIVQSEVHSDCGGSGGFAGGGFAGGGFAGRGFAGGGFAGRLFAGGGFTTGGFLIL